MRKRRRKNTYVIVLKEKKENMDVKIFNVNRLKYWKNKENLGHPQNYVLKSRIVETLNLSTCANNSTHKKIICHVSSVTCHMSHVMCHLSPVTYHLSLMPTATDPHPANSPTMHSWHVCKDPKTKEVEKRKIIDTLKKKGVLSFPILAIRSLTRSLVLFTESA